MNVDKLKTAYVQNKTVQIVCDHMAARERNQNETKTERIFAKLVNEEVDIKKSEIIAAFRCLEEADCGKYVEGRHGWPSRFVWEVKSLFVAGAAKGESNLVKQAIADTDQVEESDSEMLEHSFVLRPDLLINLDLPQDLTTSEAQRLALFITALPFERDS